MHARPTSLRRSVAAASGLTLMAGSMALTGALAAPASATSTALVINEAYVNGGSSGAAYTNKYVELQNRSGAPINLAGYSLQYRAPGSSGASTGVVALTGTIAPGGYFTLQGGSNGSGGQAVPGVDQSSNAMNPGAAGGTITLASVTTAVDPSQGTGVVDKLGWGTSNAPEGSAASGNSVTLSLSRRSTADTDVNSADFSALAPTPDAANGTVVDPPTDPPTSSERTIAEIQGTGAASPLVGSTVTTKGVVTAAFPTGGYNGFYIQTGGPDTTPGASDGIFVFEPGFADTIAVGDSVEVQGVVKEFSTLTEIDAAEITELTEPLAPAVPRAVLPGTDCALPGDACLTGAALDAAREAHEGEAFLPTAPVTVTDSYDFGATSSSFFGEIGLAAGSDIPLVTPTEVVDAQDAPGIAARTAYNTAHLVVLDDGSSANYWNTANTAGAQDQPVPWLTKDHTVRVGAGVTFDEPVVLDYRFGWKLQPQRQVVGAPTGLVTFEQDRPAAPAEVGGDIRLATFNVLNYFTTLGGDVPGCSAYVDRDDNPIATRSCSGPNGPRGAWDRASFERQQAKIVNAINTMDVDIVSLEELENSRTVDGADRDEAISELVAALNQAAGSKRWAYVPSPSTLPATEDVIRTGFIYDPATVKPVDESVIYDGPAFDNARDPLAQVFMGRRSRSSQKFAVIVNHFKSKGSGVDDGTGQGNANPDRVAQANALASFADQFARDRGTDRIFLTGDFNAYSMEDPVQVLEAAGFQSLESTDDPAEESYSFGGTSGSLDHVFANAAARTLVSGVDVWEINANESVFYQYSRYNYIGTDLYSPNPFAASDHNPEVVGLRLPAPGGSGSR
jgi:predicted extracellular nuclease